MSKTFSLGGFAAFLATNIASTEFKTKIVLEEIGKRVQKETKEVIGHEEVTGLNGFADHKPLADSTIEDKERLGYTGQVSETDPLLRTGEMRESITHVLRPEHDAVVIGSPLDIAVYQEIGTDRIPPRSFLGIGAERCRDDIEKYGIELALSMFKK